MSQKNGNVPVNAPKPMNPGIDNILTLINPLRDL
jgi:hypothetical protein